MKILQFSTQSEAQELCELLNSSIIYYDNVTTAAAEVMTHPCGSLWGVPICDKAEGLLSDSLLSTLKELEDDWFQPDLNSNVSK